MSPLLGRWVIPALATALGVALFVHLGQWQQGKAEHVEAALAQYAARAQRAPVPLGATVLDASEAENVRFVVRGRYDAASQFFIDNRQEDGVAGVHVVTPLQIEGSDRWVLVNRGWVGWPHGRGQLPIVSVPQGPVQVTGLAQVPSTRKFLWMPDRQEAASNLWERLDLARYVALSRHTIQPVVLLEESGAADGLIRHWPAPENRAPMHRSYALQWYGMAAALLVFYGVTLWRALTRRSSAHSGV